MKPNLLQDVLREGGYDSFREQLATRVRAEARRKRRASQPLWWALAASIVFAVISLDQPAPIQSIAKNPPPAPAYEIRTQPINPAFVLETKPAANIFIGDDELLSMFASTPTALSQGRLIFLNPEDRQRFMISN